ncbi:MULTISPECIES: hypothetical protein [Chryseobacterium]|uniref:Uncharacterized protein n=1 Tax=Chryseobacterium fistulae TaxID=2675058 RepID=A0A6N4XTC5_9FLAO|nr:MULTISPECIES: hypothetical protein [Chryseobacterium]REC39985.1 hypothetical protein DRF69_20575 [Chryseobacterium sp. 5_R23647]CAA7393255.1 hypothetical protein CHRY9393_03485 [Chryseobacterium fistulae]
MSDLLNDIVFKRLIYLRKELNLTQSQFVDSFNNFIKENNIKLSNKSNNPLKADNYSNIERRLTTQTESFIHFVKYYQVEHDINPAWLFTEDNTLVSKYMTEDLEAARLNKLQDKLSKIKELTEKLQLTLKE